MDKLKREGLDIHNIIYSAVNCDECEKYLEESKKYV